MPSPDRIQAIALRRQRIVQAFRQLKAQIGAAKAALAVGSSTPTLWRWEKRLAAHGVEGLRPRWDKVGRRSAAAGVHFSAASIREMQRLIVKTGSVRRAWLQFSQGPHCPPAVAKMAFTCPPAPFVRLFELTPLQVRCKGYPTADGRRLHFKIKARL